MPRELKPAIINVKAHALKDAVHLRIADLLHSAYTQARDFSAHGSTEFESLITAASSERLAPILEAALMRGWTAERS